MTDERPAADRQPRIGGGAAAMALWLSILSGACQAQQITTYDLSTKRHRLAGHERVRGR